MEIVWTLIIVVNIWSAWTVIKIFRDRERQKFDAEATERVRIANQEREQKEKDAKSWAYQRVALLETGEDRVKQWLAGPKYCEKHKQSYDVGNCLQCDIENATGPIGKYAQQIQNPDLTPKPVDYMNGKELEKDKNVEVQPGDIIEVRSGYYGVLRAQVAYEQARMAAGIYSTASDLKVTTSSMMKSFVVGKDYYDIDWPKQAQQAEKKLPEVPKEPEELFPQTRKIRSIA